MLVVFVIFKIKPEHRQQFLDASFKDASTAIKKESGCRRFDISEDLNDHNTLYFYEIYTDKSAFDEHLKTPHFLEWKNTVKDDWFKEPIVINQSTLIFPKSSA